MYSDFCPLFLHHFSCEICAWKCEYNACIGNGHWFTVKYRFKKCTLVKYCQIITIYCSIRKSAFSPTLFCRNWKNYFAEFTELRNSMVLTGWLADWLHHSNTILCTVEIRFYGFLTVTLTKKQISLEISQPPYPAVEIVGRDITAVSPIQFYPEYSKFMR